MGLRSPPCQQEGSAQPSLLQLRDQVRSRPWSCGGRGRGAEGGARGWAGGSSTNLLGTVPRHRQGSFPYGTRKKGGGGAVPRRRAARAGAYPRPLSPPALRPRGQWLPAVNENPSGFNENVHLNFTRRPPCALRSKKSEEAPGLEEAGSPKRQADASIPAASECGSAPSSPPLPQGPQTPAAAPPALGCTQAEGSGWWPPRRGRSRGRGPERLFNLSAEVSGKDFFQLPPTRSLGVRVREHAFSSSLSPLSGPRTMLPRAPGRPSRVIRAASEPPSRPPGPVSLTVGGRGVGGGEGSREGPAQLQGSGLPAEPRPKRPGPGTEGLLGARAAPAPEPFQTQTRNGQRSTWGRPDRPPITRVASTPSPGTWPFKIPGPPPHGPGPWPQSSSSLWACP